MRKRKAALVLSAGAMGLSSAAMGVPTGWQTEEVPVPTVQPELRLPAAMLGASQSLKEAMIQEEGVRTTVYRDVAGYPTVGVGHLITPEDGLAVGQKVSQERILEFFDKDIGKAEAAAARLAGATPLFQHEFDALVDLVYNVGEGNVSAKRSPRLNQAIADRDYNGIAQELDYTNAGGATAKGLVYRSERRANIFMGGQYADPRMQA
ncbi:lysozyme [Altericroceibacterium xinjiangense]|uniref:lysozyme n=1 Tax=Altericroceibacterium xinjiangense TaxID=762261 RepID=UPI001F49B154|nr:lysozyme [Altericroceibacterium xinjiangense]